MNSDKITVLMVEPGKPPYYGNGNSLDMKMSRLPLLINIMCLFLCFTKFSFDKIGCNLIMRRASKTKHC